MIRQFEMTEAQLQKLLASMKPTPVMLIGGVNTGRSAQENANAAWASLGAEMGFEPMSVQPVAGRGTRFFTAKAVDAPKAACVAVDESTQVQCDVDYKGDEIHELLDLIQSDWSIHDLDQYDADAMQSTLAQVLCGLMKRYEELQTRVGAASSDGPCSLAAFEAWAQAGYEDLRACLQNRY